MPKRTSPKVARRVELASDIDEVVADKRFQIGELAQQKPDVGSDATKRGWSTSLPSWRGITLADYPNSPVCLVDSLGRPVAPSNTRYSRVVLRKYAEK